MHTHPLVATTLAFCAAAPGQTAWNRQYPSQSPPARFAHAIAYDSARQHTLVFGGQAPQATAEFWQWNGITWTLIPAAGPTARTEAAMVFDSVRGVIVLFGGMDTVGSHLQDTWEWNGTSWSLRLPAVRPAPRYDHAMAFDPGRGRTVLFGGYGASNHMGDLWEWDGQDWQQRAFASGPAARSSSAMAFDPTLGGVLLFGGGGARTYDDTWRWDGAQWQQLQPPTMPYRRLAHSMVGDTARRRVVLYGGDPADPYAWEWDGTAWQTRFVSSPSPRNGCGLAYDTARREVVMFGGYGGFDDTWVFRTSSPAQFTPYGQGCPGSAGTPVLANAPYSLPWLGDTLTTRVTSVPSTAPVVFLTGASSTPATHLASYGMPGCFQFVDVAVAAFTIANGGLASWSIAVPNAAAIAGTSLFQQALVLDTVNAFGGVVSNAADLRTGIR
jgi:hypothetical protein